MIFDLTAVVEDLAVDCHDSEECPFGLWINALWDWCGWIGNESPNERFEFSFHKKIFFALLERLLREGKVVLTDPPDHPTATTVNRIGYAWAADPPHDYPFPVWDAPIDEQINYMRKVFPKHVTDTDDPDLNFFWYSTACPRIGWVDPKTGKIIAS